MAIRELSPMKVFVLIMTDQDMRPRSDETTTAVFLTREAALEAMECDIETAIENEQVAEQDIERHPERGYVCTADGRLSWKIESKILAVDDNANS